MARIPLAESYLWKLRLQLIADSTEDEVESNAGDGAQGAGVTGLSEFESII